MDTLILFFQIDPVVAMVFIGALVVLFVPRIGWVGIAAIIFLSFRLGIQINIFMSVLGAGVAGAILGCLPGMGIGGIVGLAKRRSIPRAPGVEPESGGTVFALSMLPLAAGTGIIAWYWFWFTPWLVEVLV